MLQRIPDVGLQPDAGAGDDDQIDRLGYIGERRVTFETVNLLVTWCYRVNRPFEAECPHRSDRVIPRSALATGSTDNCYRARLE